MKKTLLNILTVATLFFASAVYAQVGVGVPAENMHPSAELEVKSTNKGFLPPRMTKAERDAIVAPAAGLLVYQTDGDETNPTGLYFFDGIAWKNGLGVKGDKGDKGESGATGTSGSLTSGTTIGEMNYWDGSSWVSLKPGTQNQGLLFCDGLPTWTTGGICPGKIASLNCAGVSVNGSLNYGVASSNVSFVIPYTGGNGASYSAQNISSTGVTGLTATLRPGSFTNGNGSVIYEIDGMPSTSGTASFELNIGGKTCTLAITVNSPSYIVTLDPLGGTVSVTSQTVKYGSAYGTLPSPTKDGYTFTGWYFNGNVVTAETNVATASNHSLVAQWKANRFLVTLDPSGGSVSVTSKTVTLLNPYYGDLPTPTKDGYTFTGWDFNGTSITATTYLATESNHSLVAQWKGNSYIVTLDPSGGSISVTSKTVTYGSAYGDLPTPTKDGHYFSYWETNGTYIYAQLNVATASNHTLVAKWNPNSFLVTLDPSGGSVSVTSKTITLFNPYYIDLPTPTKDGYAFTGWYFNGTLIEEKTRLATNSNHILVAQWVQSTGNYGPNITDLDGNTYKTVTIGTQYWMAENLKVTRYNNGTVIPEGEYIDYKYGRLYTWNSVGYGKGDWKNACPTGWHIPNDAEWTILTEYLGGKIAAGGKMKELGTKSWSSPNIGATNSSLFTALPGGFRSYAGNFYDEGNSGYFWCGYSSLDPYTLQGVEAWFRKINFNGGDVIKDSQFRTYQFSVRCIKD